MENAHSAKETPRQGSMGPLWTCAPDSLALWPSPSAQSHAQPCHRLASLSQTGSQESSRLQNHLPPQPPGREDGKQHLAFSGHGILGSLKDRAEKTIWCCQLVTVKHLWRGYQVCDQPFFPLISMAQISMAHVRI